IRLPVSPLTRSPWTKAPSAAFSSSLIGFRKRASAFLFQPDIGRHAGEAPHVPGHEQPGTRPSSAPEPPLSVHLPPFTPVPDAEAKKGAGEALTDGGHAANIPEPPPHPEDQKGPEPNSIGRPGSHSLPRRPAAHPTAEPSRPDGPRPSPRLAIRPPYLP